MFGPSQPVPASLQKFKNQKKTKNYTTYYSLHLQEHHS
jgi:hypothetical protein